MLLATNTEEHLIWTGLTEVSLVRDYQYTLRMGSVGKRKEKYHPRVLVTDGRILAGL